MRLTTASVLLTLLALAASTHGNRFARRAAPAWRADSECPKLDECPAGETKSLLLLGIDGFRPDYMRWYRGRGQALRAFSQCGLRARFLRPVFPTNTFPNFYSIATGLYPESHGIVDNRFFDPVLNASFELGEESSTNPQFWSGEPIWNTAKRQGKKTATMFWPGSDVPIGGQFPDTYREYNSSVSLEERVQTVLKWMSSKETRPHFATLYLNEPDRMGHRNGPESTQVVTAFETVDMVLDALMQGLFEMGILSCVDVLLVSDHGMVHSGCDKMIPISTLVPDDFYALTSREFYGETGRFELSDEFKDREDAVIGSMGCVSNNVRAYSKQTLPRRLHYGGSNPRIENILLDLDPGHTLVDDETEWCMKGRHGWDPMYRSMSAYFAAFGKSFKSAEIFDPIESIEIYNLMCHLLNIDPAPNNGTAGSLFHLLAESQKAFKKLGPEHFPLAGNTSELELKNLGEKEKVLGCNCDFAYHKARKPGSDADPPEKEVSLNDMNSHAPWGIPVAFDGVHQSSLSMVYLTQSNFVIGFSKQLNMPLWVSFVISSQQESGEQQRQETRPKRQVEQTGVETCWGLDTRLPLLSDATCSLLRNRSKESAALNYESLIPAELFEDGRYSRLTSTLIPLRTHFAEIVKSSMTEHVEAWLEHFKNMHITIGPVFDYDGDGIKDELNKSVPAIPSHIFYIFKRCLEDPDEYAVQQCPEESLDAIAVVLPNDEENVNCEAPPEFLSRHSARIRDIEMLTGLYFPQAQDTTENLRLRMKVPGKVWPMTPRILGQHSTAHHSD